MKKPNLEFDLSTILDSYATQIDENSGIPNNASAAATNFAEAGLFLQSSTHVFAKQVDLLYKKGLKINSDFVNLLSTNRENENQQHEEQDSVRAPTPSTSGQTVKKVAPKEIKKKTCTKEKPIVQPSEVVNDQETLVIKTEVEEKIEKSVELKKYPNTQREKLEHCIQNILNRVVTNPHLQDIDLGILSDDCLNAADASHPLHPIFVMIGDELNIAKDLFTVNDVELTGLCWKILYLLESKLNSLNPSVSDKNTSVTCTNNGKSSSDTNADILSTETCATSTNSEKDINNTDVKTVDNNTSDSEQCTAPVCEKELRVCLEQLPESILTKYTKRSESIQTVDKVPIVLLDRIVYVQNVKINLFDLPEKLLKKKQSFKLPSDYFQQDIRLRPRNEKRTIEPDKQQIRLKRRQIQEPEVDEEDVVPLKMIKSYDLNDFENFSYEFYVQTGIITPNPVENNRKSVDARSDISFFGPVTPDSGRYSLSQGIDSEYENPDTDGEQVNLNLTDTDLASSLHAENDENDCCTRPDSVMEISSFHDAGYESDRTIVGLKQIFPNISNNPEMLSLAKEIINSTKPPESENYLEWKKFIDNKTAGEKEFDIHEFGTNILNAFPNQSAENVVSFKNIVHEKSTEDITRYFVSTLQLANTNNIEICDQYPGQMRPDSMQLKLLSRSRYHETFDATPDVFEEQFMDKLISRRSEQLLQSTPHKVNKHRVENVQKIHFSL
ncbi:hypothetical protein CBL_07098 [Carabus blaptoides fortunei]